MRYKVKKIDTIDIRVTYVKNIGGNYEVLTDRENILNRGDLVFNDEYIVITTFRSSNKYEIMPTSKIKPETTIKVGNILKTIENYTEMDIELDIADILAEKNGLTKESFPYNRYSKDGIQYSWTSLGFKKITPYRISTEPYIETFL